MQHILSSSRGRFATNQQDLVRIATEKSSMKEDIVTDMPVCQLGFVESDVDDPGNYVRMAPEQLRTTIAMLLRFRPSFHILDVRPIDGIIYRELPCFVESPEVFKTSFMDKAEIIQDEFMRNPGTLGFRMELHNIGQKLGESPIKPGSVSLYMYLSTVTPPQPFAPVNIRIRFRDEL